MNNESRRGSSNWREMPRESRANDGDLIVRASAGDEGAFTELYRRWQGPIFRFALHMSGSAAMAEDVTQEVFLAVIEGAVKFDAERGNGAGLLFGIARNHVLRRKERERGFVEWPQDKEASEQVETKMAAANLSRRNEHTVREEKIESIRRAIVSLPVQYREAVALCDLEEMDYERAAEALGCTAGTVASRLHRGRALLAAKLRRSKPVEAKPARV
jgi:RNA polymerase sigma-70 factor (ECF subfamily)